MSKAREAKRAKRAKRAKKGGHPRDVPFSVWRARVMRPVSPVIYQNGGGGSGGGFSSGSAMNDGCP
jgi:hypothetical protein